MSPHPTLLSQLDSWSGAVLGLALRQLLLAAVVFVVVLGLTRLLRGRWPGLHCCLWGLVLLRLVLPPGLSHPWSAGSLLASLQMPGLASGTVATAVAGQGAEASAGPGPVSGIGGAQGHAPGPSLVLLCLWSLLSCLLLWRWQRQTGRYRAITTAAEPVTRPELLDQVTTWRRRLQIRRPVRLVCSAAAGSPFTMGSLRPVVVLPETLLDRPATAEVVIAHELAHVARWDSLTLSMQRLLEAVYFFFPVLWVTARRLDSVRELACDSTVLSYHTIPARRYARALLDVLQHEPAPATAPAPAPLRFISLRSLSVRSLSVRCLSVRCLSVRSLLAQKERSITMRFRSILAGHRQHRPHPLLLAAFVALLGGFLLPLANEPVTAAPAVSVSPAGPVANPDLVKQDPEPAASAIQRNLQSPLPGARVSWGYTKARDPFTGKLRQHSGIDLVAGAGTPVLAAADGQVTVATTSWDRAEAWGHVVVVDHGEGLTTLYAHLGTLVVEPGQQVDAGEPLAEVGSTGKSTGPHLHFEVQLDGEHQDPSLLVSSW